MTRKKELIKNTLIILAGKLCTQFITFLLLPLYTSYLITEEYGFVDLVTTYISLLVPVFSLQLEMAIFRFLIDVRNDENKRNKCIFTNIVSLLILIIITLLFYLIINILFNIKYGYYIVGIIVFNMISSDFMQIARGIGKNLDYSIGSVISGTTTILLNLIFIVGLNMGAKGMLLSMLIANIACSLYLFIKLKIYKCLFKNRFDFKLLVKMLKYAIPLIPNGIAWWIMSASDRTIISFFLGVSMNGVYAVSNKFPTILSGFFGIFNLSWNESLSLNINDSDKNEYVSSVFNDVLKIFGCVGLLIISFLPLIFNILVKGDYKNAYFYIPILIVSSIFSLLASQYGSIYVAMKQTKKIAITTVLSSVINIIVHLCLIESCGLYAAALSTLISYLSMTIYRMVDTKKYINVVLEKKILLKLSFAYLLVIISYYYNNFMINILTFFISSLVSLLLNKKYIINLIDNIKNKKRLI